jgi:hypothetical protein
MVVVTEATIGVEEGGDEVFVGSETTWWWRDETTWW